jgi:hypothetical protein
MGRTKSMIAHTIALAGMMVVIGESKHVVIKAGPSRYFAKSYRAPQTAPQTDAGVATFRSGRLGRGLATEPGRYDLHRKTLMLATP